MIIKFEYILFKAIKSIPSCFFAMKAIIKKRREQSMKSTNYLNGMFLRVTLIVAMFFLFTANAWAGGANTGWIAGSIAGLISATVVMYRIHPFLGILTLFASLVNVARMIS